VRLHVGDLDGSRTTGSTWTAKVTILVHNASEANVGGVGVAVMLTNGSSGNLSCTTAANGTCTVSKSGIPNSTPSVTFTVLNLTLAKAAYVSASNHDPDGDSNGTAIVVKRQ
jgi:hypothetical protein